MVIEVSALPEDAQLRDNHRLQIILHWLGRCDSNGLLAVLTDEVVIREHLAIEEIMGDRHTLVGSDYGGQPLAALTLWRNSFQGREQVLGSLRACALGQSTHLAYAPGAAFAGLERVSWAEQVAGTLFTVQVLCHVDPVWLRQRTFALVVGPLREAELAHGAPAWLTHALVSAQQEGRLTQAQLQHAGSQAYPVPDEAMTVFNPGQPIGLVMLYTPNIASFGQIAETRLREYATARGYSACVFRRTPEGWNEGHSANWAKPWVLRERLAHHAWVFWVDADVLVQSFEPRLESLIDGRRDALLTWDVGGWRMNSGLFALERTPAVMSLLDHMIAQTQQVEDKSGVYHSGGDQRLWIDAFNQAGWLDDRTLTDVIALNTPWYYQLPDSFMVHYFSVWPEMRTLLMDAAYWRTRSQCSETR